VARPGRHRLGTARNYDLAVRTLSKKIVDTPIDRIRAATLCDLFEHVEAEHGVHSTRAVHALVSGALTHARRMEWTAENVARRVQPPAQPKRARTDPTTDEVRRLLLLADHDRELEACIRLHASLGFRRGEVLALRWSDVDVERAQVNIQRDHDPVSGLEKAVKAQGSGTWRSARRTSKRYEGGVWRSWSAPWPSA
jgi:integrase